MSIGWIDFSKDERNKVLNVIHLLDEPGAVDLNNQSDNESAQVPIVQKYLSDKMSWSDMWMKIGQDIYGYDENFMSVSKYAMDNGISRFKRNNK